MKHDYWPRQLAVTAIAAMFAVPLAQAQQTTETPPISLPLGVTIPGLSNTIDMMKGNDARDTRDSTVLRNDVNVEQPTAGRAEGDSAVVNSRAGVVREDAYSDGRLDPTHGDISGEADGFPGSSSTRGTGDGNAGAAAANAGGGAGGGNGG